jgi:neutral ceramidase
LFGLIHIYNAFDKRPKLVALPAGEMTEPWEWSPSIVALQILRIGNFEIVGAPGEYTTMSGRRLRNAICNITGSEVAIAGLANNYINYITTPEEYDTQEYEAGATIYGRNTLPVTIAIFEQMARALQNVTKVRLYVAIL